MFLRMLSLIYNSLYCVISFIYSLFSLFHTVLPYGLDVGLVSVTAYFLTKLRSPEPSNVKSIFGPDPRSKESKNHPEKVVRCIAHRGAGLDAPENTMEAFKYCVEHDCNMVELDVRSSKDGKLVLLHDQGLQRLTGSDISNVHAMDWESIKDFDVGFTHPNRLLDSQGPQIIVATNDEHLRMMNEPVPIDRSEAIKRKQFKEVRLCLLDEALDYLIGNNVKIIIDVKGENKEVVNGVLDAFAKRPSLYEYACVTSFNPFILYQIRKRDPQIVGALSYRPYCFSAQDYDAETGPSNFRYGNNIVVHSALRLADSVHSLLWRWSARWCNVSAVLLHKDIVSPTEVSYWRALDIRCAGWCVNRPLEKLYWRGVLKTPYLANTLLGEPEVEKKSDREPEDDRTGSLVDELLETERRMSSGQN